jgi:hypothetical protein
MMDRILTTNLPPFQLHHIQSVITSNTTSFTIESVGPVGDYQSFLWVGMVAFLWCWSVTQCVVMVRRNQPCVTGHWLYAMVTHIWCLVAWLMQGTRAPWELCASLAWLDVLIWVLVIQGCNHHTWSRRAAQHFNQCGFQRLPLQPQSPSRSPRSKQIHPIEAYDESISNTHLNIELEAKSNTKSNAKLVTDLDSTIDCQSGDRAMPDPMDELFNVRIEPGPKATLQPIQTHWNWIMWIGLYCWLVFGVCFVSAWWLLQPTSVWPVPLLLMPCVGQLLAMYDHQRAFTWIAHIGGVLLPLFILVLLM